MPGPVSETNEGPSDDEPEIPDWALPKPEKVFTHCNVCGILLRTDDEDRMGMCERCADE